MKRVLFTSILILASFWCLAQKEKPVQDELPTENLAFNKDSNKKANKPKRKTYDVIYVPNANRILYGNKCATEETRKMGFEYLVEPPNISGSKTGKGKFINNLWVKTKLVVTRTPFWKMILNKKIKKCRTMSGDLVG